MAKRKGYRVKRPGWAPKKGGGDVHITRQNADQIPNLLTAQSIRERVQSGAFEEHDTDIEESTPEDIEAAELLEAKAGLAPRKKKES